MNQAFKLLSLFQIVCPDSDAFEMVYRAVYLYENNFSLHGILQGDLDHED